MDVYGQSNGTPAGLEKILIICFLTILFLESDDTNKITNGLLSRNGMSPEFSTTLFLLNFCLYRFCGELLPK